MISGGSISFKNYFKQLPVPFKLYADFECILENVVILSVILLKIIVYTQKNSNCIFFEVLLTKLVVLI